MNPTQTVENTSRPRKQTGVADIRTNTAGFMGMLNRLHHVGAAALPVIGMTGIYLWFKLHNERLIGTVLLAASLAYSSPLIILMRTAR